jgi:hypothetical protein
MARLAGASIKSVLTATKLEIMVANMNKTTVYGKETIYNVGRFKRILYTSDRLAYHMYGVQVFQSDILVT